MKVSFFSIVVLLVIAACLESTHAQSHAWTQRHGNNLRDRHISVGVGLRKIPPIQSAHFSTVDWNTLLFDNSEKPGEVGSVQLVGFSPSQGAAILDLHRGTTTIDPKLIAPPEFAQKQDPGFAQNVILFKDRTAFLTPRKLVDDGRTFYGIVEIFGNHKFSQNHGLHQWIPSSLSVKPIVDFLFRDPSFLVISYGSQVVAINIESSSKMESPMWVLRIPGVEKFGRLVELRTEEAYVSHEYGITKFDIYTGKVIKTSPLTSNHEISELIELEDYLLALSKTAAGGAWKVFAYNKKTLTMTPYEFKYGNQPLVHCSNFMGFFLRNGFSVVCGVQNSANGVSYIASNYVIKPDGTIAVSKQIDVNATDGEPLSMCNLQITKFTTKGLYAVACNRDLVILSENGELQPRVPLRNQVNSQSQLLSIEKATFVLTRNGNNAPVDIETVRL